MSRLFEALQRSEPEGFCFDFVPPEAVRPSLATETLGASTAEWRDTQHHEFDVSLCTGFGCLRTAGW